MKIVVPPLGLGDEVAFTPVIRELRRRYPQERIVLEGFRRPDLYENNPYLHGGTEESGRTVTVAHDKYWDAPSLSQKWAKHCGVHLDDDTPELFLSQQEREKHFGVRGWRGTVAIDTWCSRPQRRWPMASFQRLADLLKASGFTVFEVGAHPPEIKLAGIRGSFLNGLSVRHTAVVMSRVECFVGNDSGGYHLAAAVGTPQVVLFSLVRSRRRAYKSTVGIESPVPCGCGWSGVCTVAPLPRCLTDVPVEQVLEAVRLVIQRRRQAQ